MACTTCSWAGGAASTCRQGRGGSVSLVSVYGKGGGGGGVLSAAVYLPGLSSRFLSLSSRERLGPYTELLASVHSMEARRGLAVRGRCVRACRCTCVCACVRVRARVCACVDLVLCVCQRARARAFVISFVRVGGSGGGGAPAGRPGTPSPGRRAAPPRPTGRPASPSTSAQAQGVGQARR